MNSKLKKGFDLRKKKQGVWPWLSGPADMAPIWFHCASGEFEYAKPVIRELKKTQPHLKILVTYFSPSVVKSLESSPEVDFFCPTPWDTKKNWQQFIDHYKPQALLIARTDLWPGMIVTAKRNGIPRLLFSKTVAPSQGPLQKFFSRILMRRLSDIFCVSQEDSERLYKNLKPYKNIHNSGDTRYDQCLFRLAHPRPLKPLKNFNRPVFVAGSTWPDDENCLYPLIKDAVKDVSFIVAPHEPTDKHLESIEERLEQMDVKYQRYSQTDNWDPQAVLVIDQVGILADLYSWGEYAFIGGSMERSVHSVMEPLAQGLLCFVGPYHKNNREAVQFNSCKIQDMTPVQVVKNSDEMHRRFQALYRSWSPSHQMDLRLSVQKRSGSSKFVVKWLSNHLKPRP